MGQFMNGQSTQFQVWRRFDEGLWLGFDQFVFRTHPRSRRVTRSSVETRFRKNAIRLQKKWVSNLRGSDEVRYFWHVLGAKRRPRLG